MILPEEMHKIGMEIHRLYETAEDRKEETQVVYRGEHKAGNGFVRVYHVEAVDCDSDTVPALVTVVSTDHYVKAICYQGAGIAVLWDDGTAVYDNTPRRTEWR